MFKVRSILGFRFARVKKTRVISHQKSIYLLYFELGKNGRLNSIFVTQLCSASYRNFPCSFFGFGKSVPLQNRVAAQSSFDDLCHSYEYSIYIISAVSFPEETKEYSTTATFFRGHY